MPHPEDLVGKWRANTTLRQLVWGNGCHAKEIHTSAIPQCENTSFQNLYGQTARKAVGMDCEVKEIVLKTQDSSQFLGSYGLKTEELWSQSTSVRSEKSNNPQKSIPEHSDTGQIVRIRYSPGYPRKTEPKNQRTCPSICNSQYSRCNLLSTSFKCMHPKKHTQGRNQLGNVQKGSTSLI